MKKIKIFGVSVSAFPLFSAIALASVIISGVVIANVIIFKTLNFGKLKINEEKTMTLATVEQPVTDWVNLSTTCVNGESIAAIIKNPVSSTLVSTQLNLNGTTILNDPTKNQTIEPGNITIVLRAQKQNFFNCSIDFSVNANLTNITWV